MCSIQTSPNAQPGEAWARDTFVTQARVGHRVSASGRLRQEFMVQVGGSQLNVSCEFRKSAEKMIPPVS